MTTLIVGSGQEFATIAAAVTAARPGDTVHIEAGTYTNDFPGHVNGLAIEGVGGQTRARRPRGSLRTGKAYLDVVGGKTTLRNLDISGVAVP